MKIGDLLLWSLLWWKMLHRGQHFVAEVYSRLNLDVKKKIRCVIGADCLGGLLSPQGPQQKDAPSLCLPGAYSFFARTCCPTVDVAERCKSGLSCGASCVWGKQIADTVSPTVRARQGAAFVPSFVAQVIHWLPQGANLMLCWDELTVPNVTKGRMRHQCQ